MDSELSIPLHIGLLLVLGLLAALQASRFGLPRIVGYLLVGMVFSPHILGDYLGFDISGWSEILTSVALGVIAFIIGGSMTLQQLRRMGKLIFSCALGESLGAVLMVILAVWLLAPLIGLGQDAVLPLALGAIAATTAPAATVAVIHQFRARGELSETLLGVVAIDDAIGIIAFSVILVFLTGQGLGSGVGNILREVGGAIVLGGVAAALLATYARHIHQGGLRLTMIIGHILLVSGLAAYLEVAPLLAGMALGFFSRIYLRSSADRLFAPIEYFEELVFAIFFTLAGAHFDITVIADNLALVLIYLLARMLGKVGGSYLAAGMIQAPANIRNWLGIALLPQAGIAVGLALTVSQIPQLAGYRAVIINTIIATTIIYELLGPFAVKFSLARAGELGERRS